MPHLRSSPPCPVAGPCSHPICASVQAQNTKLRAPCLGGQVRERESLGERHAREDPTSEEIVGAAFGKDGSVRETACHVSRHRRWLDFRRSFLPPLLPHVRAKEC
jgi:hypothetical protein